MNTSHPMQTFPPEHPSGEAVSRAGLGRRSSLSIAAVALAPIAATLSAPAHAYVGPGAGLGVIGTLFGIVAALVLALFGLFWYPLKRAFGKKAVAGGAPPADPSPPNAPSTASGTEEHDAPVRADTVRHEAPAEERDVAR